MIAAIKVGCEFVEQHFYREGFMSTNKKWRSILCINENLKQITLQGMTLGSMANLSVYYCHLFKDAPSLIRVVLPDVVLLDLQDRDDAESVVQAILSTDTEEAIPLICIANTRQSSLLSAADFANKISLIQKPVEILMLPELVLDILDETNMEMNE